MTPSKTLLTILSAAMPLAVACSDVAEAPDSESNSTATVALTRPPLANVPGITWGAVVSSERKARATLYSDGTRSVVAWDNGATEGWKNEKDVAPSASRLDTAEHAQLARAFLFQLVPASEAFHEQAAHDRLGIDSADGHVPLEKKPIHVISRRVSGIRLPDSYGFAQATIAGEVANFGVFWPQVPGDVLSKAQVVLKNLNSWTPKTKLQNPASTPEVVILHGAPGEATLNWRVAVRVYDRADKTVYAVDHDPEGAIISAQPLPVTNSAKQ